jgi:uncharacterized protein (DUF488 family)
MLTSNHVDTAAKIVWTMGHSTRDLEEFLGMLASFRIEALVDVRSFPGSKKYPQYGKEALAATLRARGLEYHWLPALGGRRRASPGSPNTAWRNAGFRGYADHMGTALFEQGLQQLLDIAERARTAIMCAEALWWRCHRSMIADALCVRGVEVVHIMDAQHEQTHPMTAAARIVQGKLSYAAGQDEMRI